MSHHYALKHLALVAVSAVAAAGLLSPAAAKSLRDDPSWQPVKIERPSTSGEQKAGSATADVATEATGPAKRWTERSRGEAVGGGAR